MVNMDAPLLTALLALAATFLALSLLVQVLQELYKYLRNSKALAYRIALRDFLGPWADTLIRSSVLPDVRVRGPLQLRRLRPAGPVLPLKKDALISALERSAPPWVQHGLRQLTLEADLQAGKETGPSENWKSFIGELVSAEQGSPGYWGAHSVARFLAEANGSEKKVPARKARSSPDPFSVLKSREAPGVLDAAALLKSFRTHFLPDVDHVAKNIEQFEANFDYAYRRKNVRLTFTIALIVALVGGLPLEKLWMNASRMDPETATTYAEQVLALSQEIDRDSGQTESLSKVKVEALKQAAQRLLPDSTSAEATAVFYFIEPQDYGDVWKGGVGSVLIYLLGCSLTAVVVTFGAPFWNDIASALLRLQKGIPAPSRAPAKEESNG